jgi:ABC-type polysaccharide/polyol phosphate export permease
MLHRIIGAGIGALATYLLLIIFGPKGADASMYVMPVIVGALVALLWPWVIGLILARRVKARRDEKISAEVERQVAEQTKGS